MNDYDIDWADIVDIFASEYGWTVKDVMTLNLCQVSILRHQISKRRKEENGNTETETHEDLSSKDIVYDENSQDMSYFEKTAGGKKVVREDGTVEIII